MNQTGRPPRGSRTNGNGQNRANDPRRQTNGSQRRQYISPEERARREAYERQRNRARAEAERRRRAQLEYERKVREREKAIRRQEFREDLRIVGFRLLLFLVVLVILTLLAVGVFLISFSHTPDEPADSGKITYYYGGEEKRSTSVRTSTNGDIVYFCFNDLSDYLGMSESGTADEMKFILPLHGELPSDASGDGTEESIVFLKDESKVIINGQLIELDTANRLVGTEIWVSSQFVTDYMTNIALNYDVRRQEMHISRIKDEENSTDKVTLYLEPTFKLKSSAPITGIEEDPLVGDLSFSTDPDAVDDTVVLTFASDLSDYEAYMNPDGDLRDAFLIIANSTTPADEDFTPTQLTEISNISTITETQYLSEYAARALEALFIELRANEYYSMAVYKGHSADDPADDHATGLAVDMDTYGCVTTDFQYQPEYEWLTENSWKFGFILRYPKDKTSDTDHAFEPWHYRYVGRYHAQRIHASGLSLEEYVESIAE